MKEKDKVIKFDQITRKPSKTEELSLISVGSITFELMISPDGKYIYFAPSFSVDNTVDDDLFKEYCNLLKKKFPDSIEKLIELYKSTE